MTEAALNEARRMLKHWEGEVDRLQDELCALRGHVKGNRAFAQYYYCKTCGSQIAGGKFGKPRPLTLIPLPAIDESLLGEGK